jgi:hypothetical protein
MVGINVKISKSIAVLLACNMVIKNFTVTYVTGTVVQEVATTLQKNGLVISSFFLGIIAVCDPLVDPQKILLPLFHIKLEIMQNFEEAMNQNGEGFWYLVQKFQ